MKLPFKEYFDDCEIGDSVITPGRTITETDVVMFAAFSGDWNSVHIDKEYAAMHTPFGERIAHGLLGLVVGSGLLGRVGWFTFWPQSMLSITGLDKVRFIVPILIGDTIHLEATIMEKKALSDQTGLISTRLAIKNQHEKTAISARVTLLAKRRSVCLSTATGQSHAG